MVMLSLSAAHAQGFDEAALVAQLHAKRASNQVPAASEYWFQPKNQTVKCEIVSVSATKPAPISVKWFGDCRDGRAHGVGIAVMRFGSPEGVQIAVEEYDPSSGLSAVTYRQVVKHPSMTQISAGRLASMEDTVSVETTLGKSAAGNATITTSRRYCKALECVMRIVDPMTGTTTYLVTGPSNYRIGWWESRVNNQPLYSMRALEFDGAVRAQKWIIDGVPYDIGKDLLTGASGRIVFTNELNSVLAMPFDRYVASTTYIDEAVRLSDSKLSSVYSRFCASSKDPDVQIICNPSSLIPEESEFAAAKAEAEQTGQSMLQQLRGSAASSNAAIAQQVQAQQDMQQQEQARLMQERENREALRRSFEAISQAGQAAQQYGQEVLNQSGGSQAPQVYTPTLSSPPIVHCRTIGYITTCN
jgi:hypothetical protein